MLLLWGPGAPKDAAWTLDEDVHVVTGRRGKQWLQEWDDGEITTEQGRAVHDGLKRHQQKRRKYDRRNRGTA